MLTLVCLNFGENTLSLAHMHSYNIPYLHFSSSFLKSAINNTKDALLLESLVMLAHRLDRKIVVNGVDDKPHIEMMGLMGCDYGQGGVFGENLTYDEVLLLLESNVPTLDTISLNDRNS